MRCLFFICAAAVALVAPGVAAAVPPANDSFASATAIGLPGSDTIDLTEATLEGGEPSSFCWPQSRTAWYVLQPAADVVVRAASSAFSDRVVTLYRDNGSGIGGLTQLGCAYPWSDIAASLQGGSTYYVQVGATPWSGVGSVTLQLSVIDPPVNDDFAAATTVGGLPYVDTVDMRAATVEPGEPTQPTLGPFTATSWYAFTPGVSGSYMVSTIGCCVSGQNVAVHTGSSVDGLTAVSGFRSCCQRFVFSATAGTTYMIQSGRGGAVAGSQLGVRIEETPAPSVAAFWWPPDPSIYDTVSFSASTWDPAGIGIESVTWDFGDGSGATGGSASHRYAADSDYTVQVAVTTPDGRTGSQTRTIAVRTHDVAIERFSAPQTARANQSRTLVVGLTNRRGAETVSVVLFRSRPGGGWDQVGQSTQFVPERGSRATSFAFSYTFTPEDASVGKVTFRAVAQIVGARDALPADNEAIAPPTTVSG